MKIDCSADSVDVCSVVVKTQCVWGNRGCAGMVGRECVRGTGSQRFFIGKQTSTGLNHSHDSVEGRNQSFSFSLSFEAVVHGKCMMPFPSSAGSRIPSVVHLGGPGVLLKVFLCPFKQA